MGGRNDYLRVPSRDQRHKGADVMNRSHAPTNIPRPFQARTAAELATEYIDMSLSELQYIRDPELSGVVDNLRQRLTAARGHIGTLAAFVGEP